MQIADAHISSMHMVVESTASTATGDQGDFKIKDLSTNGSFLNKVKIGKGNTKLAKSGDMISFVVTPERVADGSYSVADPTLVSQHPPLALPPLSS